MTELPCSSILPIFLAHCYTYKAPHLNPSGPVFLLHIYSCYRKKQELDIELQNGSP